MHLFPKYPRRETTLRRRREGEFYRPRIMGRESLLARSLVVSQEGRIQERRRIVVYEPVILDHPSFPRLPPFSPQVCPSRLLFFPILTSGANPDTDARGDRLLHSREKYSRALPKAFISCESYDERAILSWREDIPGVSARRQKTDSDSRR